MIIPPRKPSWTRYITLFLKSNYTIYRALRNEAIRDVFVHGRTLDVGGGEQSEYRHFFQEPEVVYESLNLSETMSPTYQADANERFPIPSKTFDHVISFDSLEHIWDINNALSEMVRVLKDGGNMLVAVPFLYPVHAEPDYHRKTAGWWEETLQELGMIDVVIEPFMWCPITTGVSVVERSTYPYPIARMLRAVSRKLMPLWGVLYSIARLRREPGERLPEKLAKAWYPFTLGYVIRAKRPRVTP